ncbi:MAG: N-acetylmuramoyl-L-alanine amidase [Candidatus Gastranaerophilales bacterium]|nr:N-acetylmuramoyl-L-alanine amidase [Candidatus Gastranaerophilales bacterium]
MKRIIYHWSAGTYHPSVCDKQHYHYIIDDKGVIHNGFFKPENNKNCIQNQYAAHTGGGNTGSVGIAFAGMLGFVDRYNKGNYPLTQKQCEAGFELGAYLADKYSLNLDTWQTIQTHYGFGKRNPKTSSTGKIDIVYLPPYPEVQSDDVENFIRKKVKWYFEKIKGRG